MSDAGGNHGRVRAEVANHHPSSNPLVLSGIVLAGANLPREKDVYGVPQGDGGILTAESQSPPCHWTSWNW